MMKQYLEIKSAHSDAILLYRMGDFYEMFYEDAQTAAPILQIALTSRDGEIPMCGIPHHALETYLVKLIRDGKKVAICEQLEDPSKTKGLVKRDVVRVLTPGCIPEGTGLEEGENHFLAAWNDDALGLLDVSTGMMRLIPAHREILPDVLEVYGVRELLISVEDEQDGETGETIPLTRLEVYYFHPASGISQIKKALGISSIKALGLQGKNAMNGVAGALIRYVQETQRTDRTLVSDIRVLDRSSLVDATTIRNLEIFYSALGEKKHSLHHILNRCNTAMGSRLFKDWLKEPLTDLQSIRERMDGVQELNEKKDLRSDLVEILQGIGDLERLSTKILYARESPRDLIALARSLERVMRAGDILKEFDTRGIQVIRENLAVPEAVVSRVNETLSDSPSVSIKNGDVIRDGVDSGLDDLRLLKRDSRKAIMELEEQERKETGISNLRVGYNRVFGYYLEVSRGQTGRVPDRYIRKQTLVNAERYITPEIKDLEERILNASETAQAREEEIYEKLREEIRSRVHEVSRTAGYVARIDGLLSLSLAASEYGYARPVMHDGSEIDIREGRHPVVERLLKEDPFTPNDCLINNEDRNILIVTGPNMGGKSTYLRQVALIVYMAHLGSFVPALEARIGLVDRIFTRVGAFDQLALGESTFMVEMLEVASILRQATSRSLVIFDEVGRGTSTFDGLSIAWAVVEHIQGEIGAKTLFATHYHELTELSMVLPGVRNLTMVVREHGGRIFFLYKVEDGTSDRSYGIEVAHLAGVPEEVVAKAREVLQNLERSELDIHGLPRALKGSRQPGHQQLTLLPTPEEIIIEKLNRLIVENLTPLEALNLLSDLKRKLDSKN